MNQFESAIDYVLRNEQKLVENEHDKGSLTKYGISLRFLKSLPLESLRKYGIFEIVNEQTIRDLTLQQAKLIYQYEFWNHAPFDKILNQDVCDYVFDMAVNMGIAPAIKCVQRATWSVFKRRSLIDDGILGEKTLDAIKRSGFLLMPALRSERAGYYRLIAEKDNSQRAFIEGWLNRAYEVKEHFFFF